MAIHETVLAVEDIVDQAAYLRPAYFWSPATSAGGRRSDEKRLSRAPVEWAESGDFYRAGIAVSETCRHIYVQYLYAKNGKKTTLTAIKSSLVRLKAAEEKEAK